MVSAPAVVNARTNPKHKRRSLSVSSGRKGWASRASLKIMKDVHTREREYCHASASAALSHNHVGGGLPSAALLLHPAALTLLGMGGSGAAATLEPDKGWFLLGAGAFFAISFYLNFIRNRSRPGMVLWGLSAVIAAGLLLGPLTAAGPGLDNEQEDAMVERQLEEVTLKTYGMACDACVRRVSDTATIRRLKALYDHHCQLCGTRLTLLDGNDGV